MCACVFESQKREIEFLALWIPSLVQFVTTATFYNSQRIAEPMSFGCVRAYLITRISAIWQWGMFSPTTNDRNRWFLLFSESTSMIPRFDLTFVSCMVIYIYIYILKPSGKGSRVRSVS